MSGQDIYHKFVQRMYDEVKKDSSGERVLSSSDLAAFQMYLPTLLDMLRTRSATCVITSSFMAGVMFERMLRGKDEGESDPDLDNLLKDIDINL